MKIEKRPSGSYRIRKMYKGKMYTVSFDHKPTQKEAMQAMAGELDRVQGKFESMTFQAAAEKYIGSKQNVLSPSTVRLYRTTVNNLSSQFRSPALHHAQAAALLCKQDECAEHTGSGYHADGRMGNRPCDEIRIPAFHDRQG